jgi:SRSO17 transposase
MPLDVQASPAELPELKDVLSACPVRFRRPEGTGALERSLTGLLTALPNKHWDTIAQAVPGTSAQRVQACLTTRPWDEHDLNRQRVQQLTAEAVRGDGVLVLDDPGVPQQGKPTVGVARPDSGTLGKGGHGPGAVPGCDTAPQATWPVAVRRYLPKAWAEAAERRGTARVPAEVTCQTKPERALALLDEARAWGVPPRGVVAAADSGDQPHCRAGLERRQDRYVVGVRPDVRGRGPRNTPGPVPRAEARLQTLPRWPWRTMRWRPGAKGGRRQKCVAVRCGRVASARPRHVGGRLGERATRGPPAERKYSGSHRSATAPVEELAGDAPRR